MNEALFSRGVSAQGSPLGSRLDAMERLETALSLALPQRGRPEG
jgi:hypothetical protein